MKKAIFLFISLIQIQIGLCQSKNNCHCPVNDYTSNTKPSKTFTLSNGQKIGVCGEAEKKSGETQYNGCVVFQCEKTKTIYESDYTTACTITQNTDTLTIQEIMPIANGKNQSIVWTKFYVEKLFFRDGKMIDTNYYRKEVKRYTAKEIKKVEAAFNNFKKENNFDALLLLSHQLFWAYVSGSKKAGEYLKSLELKFGPFDGAISEEYNEVMTDFEAYKKKK
jgi:hypothetical protein